MQASFRILSPKTVGFSLGAYDHSRALLIDPVLDFATYIDGTGVDSIRQLTTDASGYIYVVGTTTSADFPVTSAEQPKCASCVAKIGTDAFIAKLDPTGHSLIYSTIWVDRRTMKRSR